MMKRLMKSSAMFLLSILAGLGWGLFPAEVKALDTQVHGFGGWAFGITDGYKYLVGNEDGSYTNSYFALNLSASPYEKLTANVQTIWKTSDQGVETDLDYAFAEWAFREWLKLRIGKVKCPFGIYSEIWDVGTLRPFYTVPAGFYGSPGMIATKAYYGLGLTGRRDISSGWGLQYDLYGGLVVFPELIAPDLSNPTVATTLEPTMTKAGGGRFSVQTPLDGLSAGFSMTMGDFWFWNEGKPIDYYMSDLHLLIGGHLEYLRDPVLVRAEYGYMDKLGGDDYVVNAYYVEGAYKFLGHLQAAARYDVKLLHFPDDFFPMMNPPEDNKDLSFGLNYWFNPNLVIKASYHYVKGNLVATPADNTEYLTGVIAETLQKTNQLFLLGSQFSF